MRYNDILKPIKTKPKTFSIASYDIETATPMNIFIQGGFIDADGNYKSFLDKDAMIEYMLKHASKKTMIYATFNRFDYGGLFKHKTKEFLKGKVNLRNGLLMYSEYRHLRFYDTMSYTKSGVEDIGKMLGLPKLKFNVSKNSLSMSKWKMRKLIIYNRRDCEVTRQFIIGLQEVVNHLGGQLGQSIGSTAMDLFKRKYLKKAIHHEYIKDKKFSDGMTVREMIFKAYHGGRTEMFKRGFDDKNIYYKYDFNSLYPSVMLNHYPNPSSAMMSENVDGRLNIDTILKYDGITECEVVVPYMYYPILPTYYKKKLVFPIGKFRDYFTNIELRLALEHGVKITKIFKTISYTRKIKPFTRWVKELYALRMKYSDDGNMVYKEMIKLFLNNLYGKFAQHNLTSTEFLSEEERNDDDLSQEGFTFIEGSGFGYKDTPKECNQAYVIPIFAVYTTAYARIKLWNELYRLKGIYCDTDSIFTTVKMNGSSALGELKLEGASNGLNIVKQKHYKERDAITGEWKYKVKGLTLSKDEDVNKRKIERELQFDDSINGNDIQQRRIIGIKESMRGKFKLNQVVWITKKFDLRDNKRMWLYPYDKTRMRDSEPRILGFNNLKELKEYYDSLYYDSLR